MQRAIILALAGLLGLGAVADAPAPPARPDPGRPAELTLTIAPDRPIRAEGRLPGRLGVQELRRLGRIEAAGLASGAAGDPEAWAHTIDALDIALPRLEAGRIRLAERSVQVEGRLVPGFGAAGTKAALRSALENEWALDFRATEAPPAAGIEINAGPGRLTLSGILPEGLDAEAARIRLGGAEGPRLTSGGAGDPAAWRVALDRAGDALSAYAEGRAVVAEGLVAVSGRLAPGHTAAALGAWLTAQLPPGWTAEVAGEETPAAAGATRTDPATGGLERLTDGVWLPVLAFEPALATCAEQTDATLMRGGLRFQSGSADLAPGAEGRLARLAAIGRACAGAGFRLVLGGHTDGAGELSENIELGRRRAEAVRTALAALGVPARRMIAIGYGPTAPTADDGTPEGQAANRRISFAWIE